MSDLASGQASNAQSGPRRFAALALDWRVGLACLGIILAGCAAYSNSFAGPFVDDGVYSVLKNPTILHGWWEALQPPPGTFTVSGRPLVNLSVALNYELGGFNVWGYHALNLAIQLLAGLTLFGLVRRTLERPVLRGRYGAAAWPLAFLIALLWTVHPLQTESVTYVIQRAESMMGLFYLLTLYCFVRGVESSRAWFWYIWSAVACLMGMFTKETMATVPLMVLLYDRTFVAGTFAAAWRQRWKFYSALACSWLPLAWLVVSVSWPGNSGLTNAGMDRLSLGMKSYVYALKQCEAVVQYLWLSFWPHPLVSEYGQDVVTSPLSVAPQIAVLTLLVGITVYALWRRPALGFLGAWFFVILAPTSSVLPLHGQTMAEHHLYLSLAALIVLAVLGFHALLGRRTYAAGAVLALALGTLTFERNRDYRTDLSIWTDAVQKRPDNWRAQQHVAMAYMDMSRTQEAIWRYKVAMRMNSNDAAAENDLGNVLLSLNRPDEAIAYYLQAIDLDSLLAEPYYNLGNAYREEGKLELAVAAYKGALLLNPNYADAHSNLGSMYLLNFGLVDQAIAEYKDALRANPDLFQVRVNLANIYLKTDRADEAIALYNAAIKTQPNDADAYAGLGFALYATGQMKDAIPQFEKALALSSKNAATHNNYGLVLFQVGRFNDAADQFAETLHLAPDYPDAQSNLDKARQLAQQSAPSANSPKQ